MTLYEKIKTIYSQLNDLDFQPIGGTIRLENSGQGDYIALWNHPTLTKPTQEQLDEIN